MFKQAYKAAEVNYKKSIQTQHQSSTNEAIHRKNRLMKIKDNVFSIILFD